MVPPAPHSPDLLVAIHSMISLWGEGTVKVSKVKGHATQTMVDKGDARRWSREGRKF